MSCIEIIQRQTMRKLMDTILEPPPVTPSHGGAPGGGAEAGFDTNMVIILAALLCALICALGLNSIVRCVLRCGGRTVEESPEEAAGRLAGTGLKKRMIRRLPVSMYGAGGGIRSTECPICLGEFADGEKVRVLPKCNHGFHIRCIDTWLVAHSSCPTCRNSLLDRPETAGGAAAPPPEEGVMMVDGDS
ncbi:Zinc finger RING/FYVE/PHD-type protein [Dioscorea alata]|uniref:Zinc finger RING/FYVE/PHD-type protein n=1 Tax=Dioscorea alata TaxID=55571 RepID=A0ACB7VF57_DIOAL|nr:Zinc finger RING/FYVE/PHD-type protein [Dioscorea alata]